MKYYHMTLHIALRTFEGHTQLCEQSQKKPYGLNYYKSVWLHM